MEGLWKELSPDYDKYGNKISRYTKRRFRGDKYRAKLDLRGRDLTKDAYFKIFGSNKTAPLSELTKGFIHIKNNLYINKKYIYTEKVDVEVNFKVGLFDRYISKKIDKKEIENFFLKNCSTCPMLPSNIDQEKNADRLYKIEPCHSLYNLYYSDRAYSKYCERKGTNIFNSYEKFSEPFYTLNGVDYNFYTDKPIIFDHFIKIKLEKPTIKKTVQEDVTFYQTDKVVQIYEIEENENIFYGKLLNNYSFRNSGLNRKEKKMYRRAERFRERFYIGKLKKDIYTDFPNYDNLSCKYCY